MKSYRVFYISFLILITEQYQCSIYSILYITYCTMSLPSTYSGVPNKRGVLNNRPYVKKVEIAVNGGSNYHTLLMPNKSSGLVLFP